MKADQANIRTVDVHDRAGNVVGSKDVVLYAGLLNQAHDEGLAWSSPDFVDRLIMPQVG